MFLLENLLLLKCTVLVANKSPSRTVKLVDSPVVQVFHLLVKSVLVDSSSLTLKLLLQLFKLFLDFLSLLLQISVDVFVNRRRVSF